ncbi:TetR/AcrR family transcriptional regulator [Solihabitans fulvus]|uniref:TetR/AcrR family transcriptional regulator n=1 Tax=Solihabitans fulvus TaxID=1892852 RepID=A0A5B2XC23_9PSEU|nr:TetR/AcrR family transcriptional regulator [Solihabitans fulvus]KAA2261167.1 TetR/AcrR family transcriptional regulator [Solihabitans fulvus]
MNKKAERGRLTRDQLVATATELFAERGYEDTSIEAVLHEANVSRGALYHHFAGKEGLFEAVLEAVETRVDSQLVAAVAGQSDPVEALRGGCLAWIGFVGDHVVRQIVLIDAPAVLGWERWREVDQQHGLGMIRAALRATRRLPAELVDPFAHMLLASLGEIALLIARSPDPDAALDNGVAAIEELLRRVLR